ncbi:uncharacterized protein CG43867-like [Limulus polyphemus]|uniref:Uncharacterized protein CG43867-like n=1 Tax=Limulus polyphemus TaxID=6850 RepID=A0ABM1TGK3_LIMPO|nr:uncharacterized protein CG43867-like [Limulus polyphemus]
MWQQDVEINWQKRCHDLERSLQRFREQATRIRGLLKEKLEELEHRVEDAEKRAKFSEEKAKLMEDQHATSDETEQPLDLSKIHLEYEEKNEVISKLEKQVEEQKKFRAEDAKQVEAKAAKIKEWVANKLKDLEQQNQHLKEQNEKCKEQLELLKTRLVQLSHVNHQSTMRQKDRGSTENSYTRSYEGDRLPVETIEPPSPMGIELPSDVFSLTEADINYATNAAMNVSMKKYQACSAPPKVVIERKKYELVGKGGVCVDDFRSEINKSPNFDFESEPMKLDTVTPLPPRSRARNIAVEDFVNSANYTYENISVEQRKVPGPLPRQRVITKHAQEGRGSSHSSSSRSQSPASPQDRYRHTATGSTDPGANSKLLTGKSPITTYGSLDRKLGSRRKFTLTEFRGNNELRRTARTDDELHDYAEIYTPSNDIHYPPPLVQYGEEEEDVRPPTPPIHRCPSWESRIYEIAVNGINVSSDSVLVRAKLESPINNGMNAGEPSPSSSFTDLNIPVYATVKGRASQIRPVPFSEESSYSSDNEDARVVMTVTSSHNNSGETESSTSTSSPGKGGKVVNNVPPGRQNSTSYLKPVVREISSESVLSDDYAIPPDAISSDAFSIDSVEPNSVKNLPVTQSYKKERTKDSIEKSGYLTKLGGKFKTWRKRWFVLKNGVLSYYKTQNDVSRKPQGQIKLNELCRVNRAEGAANFELCTDKRTYYMTAESATTMEDWIRVLQNVLRRHATRLLLSKEENKPTIEGWLTKVKHGHSRRCWCVLIGRMFLYFKTPKDTTPMGQINMRDSRVEEVLHVSDSDEEEETMSRSEFTVGIFSNYQGPTYLLMTNKQEMDAWLYHLTVVSSGENLAGTQYEQLIARLMEVDGDENSVIWRHPLLLFSKENITQPLTTLPSEQLQAEGIKLFKSIQLFISVSLDTSGIDYHVALAQNALLQCLTTPELQNEFFCQLIKQTSRHASHKLGVQQLLLCATQSLFLCDSSSTERTSPTSITSPDRPHSAENKLNPAPFVFVQAWQLLALAIPLFVPKNRTLWYLRAHLERNAETFTEPGRYAAFCQRALERALLNSGRECQPSRMEVLSILLKNPFHHCLPHSIPVHFLNGTYQVVGFDGSSTVEEFIQTINAESGIRDCVQSGFALFTDDPIDKSLEYCLQNSAKLCDVISKWEQALREGHLGKFETTKIVKLTYKNRLCFRQMLKAETDKERLLTAYHVNEEIVQGRFPLSLNLALELAALKAQIEFGDFDSEKVRGSGAPHGDSVHQLKQVAERFFPHRYKETMTEKQLQETIKNKWATLKGRTVLASIMKTNDQLTVWIAVTEDSLVLLDYATMQPFERYPYSSVLTFGGCKDDFMLVVSQPETGNNKEGGATERLIFSMPKPKILDITLLIADYMNAMGRAPTVPPSPQASTLVRLERIRAKIRATSARSAASRPELTLCDSPDLVKMTTEVHTQHSDGKKCCAPEST